ncbi:hypothetical protein D3C80_1177310 [compost metagenome]
MVSSLRAWPWLTTKRVPRALKLPSSVCITKGRVGSWLTSTSTWPCSRRMRRSPALNCTSTAELPANVSSEPSARVSLCHSAGAVCRSASQSVGDTPASGKPPSNEAASTRPSKARRTPERGVEGCNPARNPAPTGPRCCRSAWTWLITPCIRRKVAPWRGSACSQASSSQASAASSSPSPRHRAHSAASCSMRDGFTVRQCPACGGSG